MISLNPSSHTFVTLTPQEQITLLNCSKYIDPVLLDRIRELNNGILPLSKEELIILMMDIEKEISQAPTKEVKSIFTKFHQKLLFVIKPPPPAPANKKHGSHIAEIEGFLSNKNFSSIDEMNIALQELMGKRNSAPDPEMGGLSPNQVNSLIITTWNEKSCPIKFNQELPLSELENSPFLVNMRILLQFLSEQKDDTATATGNLNRKTMAELLNKLKLDSHALESVRKYFSVINEDNVFEIHILRVIAECGKLLQKRGKKFIVSKMGKEFIAEQNAGKLYFYLFNTFFKSFNLAYLDGLPDFPGLQQTVSYPLYRLRKIADNWQKIETLPTQILLPSVVSQIREVIKNERQLDWLISTRIVRPLTWFGLLDTRDIDEKNIFPQAREIKKSSLFDKFISFNLKK